MLNAVRSYAICVVAATLLVACDSQSEPSGAVEPIPPQHSDLAATVSSDDTCCTEECGEGCASCAHCAKDAKQAAAQQFHYSPFFVQLEGEGEFEVITFKDVGLQRKDLSPTHPLLEVLAESLSYSIAHSTLGYGPAMVSFDERLADPENHRACGQNHLYVDVWKTGSGSFGYSLWSGCGEADKFAWEELDVPVAGDTLADQVEPLTKSITESIAEAKASQCFQKQC